MLYKIGKLEFKTKGKCLEFTRQVIKGLGCCEIDEKHEKFTFFMDLIENNDYYKNNVKKYINKFCIEHNKLNKHALHIRAIKHDKTHISISWRQCCGMKGKSHDLKLSTAMRDAVKSFINSFKTKQPLICNYCYLNTCDYTDYHVDHDDPPFRILRDNFINKTELDIPEYFSYDENSHIYVFDNDHVDFKNSWIKHHNDNAKLQILCKTCNLKKH